MTLRETTRAEAGWERYAWIAGILFVIAVVIADVFATSEGVTTDDTPGTIIRALHDHHGALAATEFASVAYAFLFSIYLAGLHNLLRSGDARPGVPATLLLVGGALGLVLHALPDIALVGSYGSKLTGAAAVQHDGAVVYAFYVVGYAISSAADVMLSVFALAAGTLVLGNGALPRWLGWVAVAAGILFLIQGFLLGGIIADAGVVVDSVGLFLFLIFVLGSSIVQLRRRDTAPIPQEDDVLSRAGGDTPALSSTPR